MSEIKGNFTESRKVYTVAVDGNTVGVGGNPEAACWILQQQGYEFNWIDAWAHLKTFKKPIESTTLCGKNIKIKPLNIIISSKAT